MLKSLIILSLTCTMIFGQGISYRIEALGADMAGIISDHETDVLRNPAHIVDGDFVRIQRYYVEDFMTTISYRILSGFLVRNSLGISIDGSAYYGKSSDMSGRTQMISGYFIKGRILGGLKIFQKPIGMEVGTEIIKNKSVDERNGIVHIEYHKDNNYEEVDRLKLGGIFGKESSHEIMFGVGLAKINYRHIFGTLPRHEISDSVLLKFKPRLTYLYTHKSSKNNRYFHLLFDIGQPYSINELSYPPSLVHLSDVDNEFVGRMSIGWEDLIHPKVLFGYGSVYNTNITIADTFIFSNHNVILPFSLEYKPTNYLFLRAGTSSYFHLTDEYGNNYRIQNFSNGFSYSLGLGLKFKKFSGDFVIPSSYVLCINNWKIRACYEF